MAGILLLKNLFSSKLRGGEILLSLCLLLAFAPLSGYAQSASTQGITVSGVVKDADGNALIGATVATPDGKKGVSTDINGAYIINLGAGQGVLVNLAFIN